jgi:hypothetical protein
VSIRLLHHRTRLGQQLGGSISVAEREAKGGYPFQQTAKIADRVLSVAAKIPTMLEKFHDGPGRRTAG